VSNLKPFDFALFTDKHLKDLDEQLRAEIAKRRALARRCRELSEAAGPAYRNPFNSAETWTGKGKQPKWVREVLALGRSLESLAIDRE
jgi:DNA-binding protein H-NS